MTTIVILMLCDRNEKAVSEAPGYAKRINSFQTAAERMHQTLELIFVPSERRFGRLWGVFWVVARLIRHSSSNIVLPALNAPHMFAAAWLLAVRGHRVVVDVCDSVRDLPGIKGRLYRSMLVRLRTPSTLLVTYITAADARRDTAIVDRWRVAVIGRVIEQEIRNVRPLEKSKIERIVVPADFSSPHNTAGLDVFLRACANVGNVNVDLYGPVAPSQSLPFGVRYLGWSRTLTEVYSGQTVVFAPNTSSVGLQNKIIEGFAARRPVIAAAVSPDLRSHPLLLPYATQNELEALLRRVISSEFPAQLPRNVFAEEDDWCVWDLDHAPLQQHWQSGDASNAL